MAQPFRILHVADSHIGADLPRRAGGRPRRGCDFVTSFRRVLALAHEHRVDLVIHAGDLFDLPDPGDSAIAAATQPLCELASAGIPVVLVPGNHERSALPNVLLLHHPNIHVLRTPRTVVFEHDGRRIAVAGFPCLRRNAAAQFEATLEQTGWRAAGADLNVLAVHQTFAGARCGPANFQFRTGDDVVPLAAIPPEFHYVAAGHIHRHQELRLADAGPPIVYAGSPDRVTFAELGEPKGGVLVELGAERVGYGFIEHPVRAMEIVAIDVTGMTGADLRQRLVAAVRELPMDAVVLLRLSGRATRRALAGLRFTETVRAARPDLLGTISTQAIEWDSERVVHRAARRGPYSAFDVLAAPLADVVAVSTADVKRVPATCGTYALYDADGRLLYVGKALSLRARVRSHLRCTSSSAYFADWSAQIARIVVRPARSELEALLVEAELIRRLVPAFNRQMRLWKRYYYVCPGLRPLGQLAVCREAGRSAALGPLRSRGQAEAAVEALAAYFGVAHCPEDSEPRGKLLPLGGATRLCKRHFDGLCAGPCGGRSGAAAYAARLQVRDALLRGADHPALAMLDRELAELDNAAASSSATPRERLLHEIQGVRERAVVLREARALLGALLIMPGAEDARTLAVVTPSGLHLKTLRPTAASAEHALSWLRRRATAQRRRPVPTLPKPVADVLCTAAHQLRRCPEQYAAVTAEAVARLTAPELLNAAFPPPADSTTEPGCPQPGMTSWEHAGSVVGSPA